MIIPDGFAQVTIIWAGTGLPLGAATVFGVDNPTDKSAPAIATDVASHFTSSTIVGNLANTVTTTKIRVKKGPNETGAFHEGTMTIVGGNASAGASPNVAYLLKKSTVIGGRRGRGRMFLPGVVEPAVDAAGAVASATVTALNADAQAFLDLLTAGDLGMVLLHNDTGAPGVVTALTCDSRVATQRHRLR